jgi:carbon-monoxide dehydrogenase small subunit
MMMTARALLDRNPDPSDGEIREAISGQICRCTGYATIVRSVKWAAESEKAVPSAAASAVPSSVPSAVASEAGATS